MNNEKKLKDIDEDNLLYLLITFDGKISINNKTFNLDDVNAIIKKHLSENENIIIIIQGETDAKYEHFLFVLEQTKQAGAKRILVNEPEN